MNEIAWLVQRAVDVPDDDSWLADGERRIAALLAVEKRRRDWRLGRWTAKRALALGLGQDVVGSCSAIEIRSADDGAPEGWCRGRRLDVSLSLSHRKDQALCMFGSRETSLGCDLEHLEPRSEGFVETFLTTEERAVLSGKATDEKVLLANLFWSAKESALKALRLGLAADTRRIEVKADFGDLSGRRWAQLEARDRGTAVLLRGAWLRSGLMVLTWVANPIVDRLLPLDGGVPMDTAS